MKKQRYLPIILLGLVILTTVFWRTDFRLAHSETRANASIVTGSNNPSKDIEAPHNQNVAFYVEGDGTLRAIVRQSLQQRLQTEPAFANITLLESPTDQTDQPLLVVEVSDSGSIWTPIHSQADINVRFTYSSNGDVSWGKQSPPHMHVQGPDTVMMQGDIQIDDRTNGVISRPGYHRHLADEISEPIVKAIHEAINQ